MIIKNGTIITPNTILSGYDLLIENGMIKEIGKDICGGEVFDAKGAFVTPGFVDIHTHGGYETDLFA